ncbi:YciC family protein [Buchnera aphidicola]|uniref:UPF0259 membrane protein GUU85_01285 n=1 Tax=Buchnera aphidicola subsp. Uroleucon sonchi TaxID=118118 RepID=A0A6C1F662_BUCUN|nr:YciC family protein [Buchnera aphidicola]QIE01993.1 UPF0259 family protein [Buchnera aphidicola (Uroleucon sonchi)]
MRITVRELYHDTYYFFSKQIKMIIFISISVTFLNIFLEMLFQPDMHISSIIENNHFINANSLLELINNMNIYEKHQLLKYSIVKIMIFLASKTILTSSIITLILFLSNMIKDSIISLIYSFLSFLPSLFMLNFLTVIIIQLGLMLFVVPGVLLSIILPLSPIILSFKHGGLISSIRTSMYLSWKHIKIIGPGVLFWIFGKFFITILFLSYMHVMNKNIILFMLNISINIIFSILIIYLFRFYMIFIRS